MVNTAPLLTYSDLAHSFDMAICGIESDSGSDDLYQLGLVIHVVSMAKKNSFCALTADAFGSAHTALTIFLPLIATPYPLSPQMQESYKEVYKTAKKEIVEQLNYLKKEFCENTNQDWEKVVKALGIIQFHAGLLIRKHANVMRINQSAASLPMPPPTG